MRHALLVLLFFICMPLHAEMQLETIQLQHRTADEVIGILQPMVAKGGSLSGTGYKLFVKTTPDNLEQIRKMIADIDTAPTQLLVSVSLDRAVMEENAGVSARVRVEGPHAQRGNEPDAANPKIKYDARMFERAQTERTPQVQQVRVSEGLWATIQTGQAIPIASRTQNPDGTVTETYTYTAVASGFQVLPRVSGDTVTLHIRPRAQSPNAAGGGVYNTTEVETTVSGKLGHWIPLGSVDNSQQRSGSGIVYSTRERGDESNQIYVKVERIAQ